MKLRAPGAAAAAQLAQAAAARKGKHTMQGGGEGEGGALFAQE